MAAAEAALEAPPQTVVVSKDHVVAPPPRFLSCSDESLLSYFQGALGGGDGTPGADQLAALYSLLEGVVQHDFLAQRRRLEADFALFSSAAAAGRGGAPSPAKRRLQRLSSIEEHERRFLRDFLSMMERAHYRLLGSMEWQAAQEEEFLFTLPVEVDWSALDKHLLQRFWGDHPEARASLPDLSDRILIFCRGFEPARMRGRYLTQKVELLLSFYLLAPLWAGLDRALALVGLTAPPPPLIARTPQKADITFKCAMKTAAAAVRWRRTAAHKGGVSLEDSLTVLHDACTIIERKTMSRLFPTGRSVLSRFFDVVELQEACIRDVVVLFRRKPPKGARSQGEKEVLRPEGADPAASARNIQIRQFAGMPLADLEMVMPEKKVLVPGSVFVQLVVAALAALVGLLATFWQAQLDWKVWGSALMLLGSRASQVYFQASSERNEIEREMNKLLFERTVATQEAVLHTLTDEMSRQRIRECFLCYSCLLQARRDMRDEDLDVKCERLLRKSFDLRLDFTAEAAIPALAHWGLVRRLPDGRLRAAPLSQALAALDAVWDSAFEFGPTVQASAAAAAGGLAQGGAAVPAAPGDSAGIGPAAATLTSASDGGAAAAANFLLQAVIEEERQTEEEERSLLQTDEELQLTEEQEQQEQEQEQARECQQQCCLQTAASVAARAAAAATATTAGSDADEPELEAERCAALEPVAVEVEPVANGQGFAGPAGVIGDAALAAAAALLSSGAAGAARGGEQALLEQPEQGAAQRSTPGAAAEPDEPGELHQAPLPPPVRARRITSSSSLEAVPAVTLRVPRMRPGVSAGTLLHRSASAASRITPRQLRHRESLLRQRAQQEAEALECLPSALLRATAEAAAAPSPGQDFVASESPSPRRALLGQQAVPSPAVEEPVAWSPIPEQAPCPGNATQAYTARDCPNNSCYYEPPNGCGSKSLSPIQDKIVPDEWPGGVDFNPACEGHDRCYSIPGANKTECDQAFHQAMLDECSRSGGDSAVEEALSNPCTEIADGYFQAVQEIEPQMFADIQAQAVQYQQACLGAAPAPKTE